MAAIGHLFLTASLADVLEKQTCIEGFLPIRYQAVSGRWSGSILARAAERSADHMPLVSEASMTRGIWIFLAGLNTLVVKTYKNASS